MAEFAQDKVAGVTTNGNVKASAWDLVAMGAWFGLVTGLLEGASRSVLHSLGGVSWEMLMSAASIKLIWVVPLLYVLPFALVGALLTLLRWVAPRLPVTGAAVFLFGLVSFADVLSGSGRINRLGVGMLALGLAAALTRWFNAHEKPALDFCKRSLSWVAVLVVLAFVGIEGGIRLNEQRAIAALPPAAPETPNVLIIVVDTLRADHLSLYGYSRKTSPNLEKIAAQSVFFENAIATSSWTLPSHASILTGLYPSIHGAETFPLDKRHLVLPEALGARGYQTAAFSANTVLFTRAYGFGRGFIRFEDSFHNAHDMMVRTLLGLQVRRHVLRPMGIEDIPGRKHADEVNREVLHWLDQNYKRPFFAFLNYFDLHDPHLPPQPYREKFSKRPSPGGVYNSFIGRYSARLFTPEVLEDEIAAYDGSIAYVDDSIGQLIAELDRRGLGQNTILIITSDHGESFGEHGLYGHQISLYQEELQVPLIIRWPGKIPAGAKLSTLVTLADIPATVMDLIGESQAGLFPGISLAQAWRDPDARNAWPYPAAELAATPEVDDPLNPAKSGFLKALVSRRWYYILHEKLETELFDMERDPRQLNNLVKTPEGKAVAKDFELQLRQTLARTSRDARAVALESIK